MVDSSRKQMLPPSWIHRLHYFTKSSFSAIALDILGFHVTHTVTCLLVCDWLPNFPRADECENSVLVLNSVYTTFCELKSSNSKLNVLFNLGILSCCFRLTPLLVTTCTFQNLTEQWCSVRHDKYICLCIARHIFIFSKIALFLWGE